MQLVYLALNHIQTLRERYSNYKANNTGKKTFNYLTLTRNFTISKQQYATSILYNYVI